MAIGAVQLVPVAGMTPALNSVSSSETVAVDNDDTWLEVANGSGSSITVTLVDPGKTPAGSAATNPTVTVGAGATKKISLPRALADTTTGNITVQFSATASVTAGAFRR